MKNEIEVKNELIAKFMGWIKTDKDLVFNSQINGSNNNSVFSGWIKKEQSYVKGVPLFVVKANKSTGIEYLRKLQYNTSWDWLMPVVYKCLFNTEITDTKEFTQKALAIQNALLNVEISQLYETVVQFIEWYNTNV